MTESISDPAVLRALDELEETNQLEPIASKSIADWVEEQSEEQSMTDVDINNPAVLPLATCAIQIAIDYANLNGHDPVLDFSIEQYIKALNDDRIPAQTRVDISRALTKVPGFDENLDLADYKTDPQYRKTFDHAADMAKAYTADKRLNIKTQ